MTVAVLIDVDREMRVKNESSYPIVPHSGKAKPAAPFGVVSPYVLSGLLGDEQVVPPRSSREAELFCGLGKA